MTPAATAILIDGDAATGAQSPQDDPTARRASYALVLAVYAALVTVIAFFVRRGRIRLPERIAVSDVATMAVATQRIAKLLAKEPVTSPLRAPFTEFVGVGGPAELDERARDDSPLRHTLGELLTCPYCLGQWVATALVVGHLIAPRAARAVATTFAVSGTAEWLQVGLGKVRDAGGGG